jgi:membrane associated rhomboid family serine protease
MDEEIFDHNHWQQWMILSPPGERSEAAALLDEGRARRLSLLLESRSIPFHLERAGRGWFFLIPADFYQLALHEVELFEEENRAWPPVEPPARPLVENTLATLSVLLLLAVFHNITLLGISPSGQPLPDWRALGSADAALILQGEWWRVITALTLHSGWAHLSGNLVIGGMFILLICRDLGAGLAWSLILASGALGNLVNALLQQLHHNAIGASTAVFGAVGILAASSFVRYRHRLRSRRVLPVAAALALLAILGTEGEHTDLGAHLFGFLWGILLGFMTEKLMEKQGRPSRSISALLALSAALVVGAAWSFALGVVG